MATFCITSSNPEFQKLAAESGKKQGVFAMMVSKWMTQNEVYDRYPTLQELGISQSTPQLEIEDKASESGLSLSTDEAAAYNSLVSNGTIPIKCK
jgi:hypothetical protein